MLNSYGITHINHWSGYKVGDGRRVIPQDTELIVLVRRTTAPDGKSKQ